jgi:hypothetical protein
MDMFVFFCALLPLSVGKDIAIGQSSALLKEP